MDEAKDLVHERSNNDDTTVGAMERNDNDDDNNVDETTNLLRGRSCDFSCVQMLSDEKLPQGDTKVP